MISKAHYDNLNKSMIIYKNNSKTLNFISVAHKMLELYNTTHIYAVIGAYFQKQKDITNMIYYYKTGVGYGSYFSFIWLYEYYMSINQKDDAKMLCIHHKNITTNNLIHKTIIRLLKHDHNFK